MTLLVVFLSQLEAESGWAEQQSAGGGIRVTGEKQSHRAEGHTSTS